MSDLPRRAFIKQSAVGLAGAAALSAATGARDNAARANDANSRLRFGLIGCGGRGTSVAGRFLELPNVELAYVCDLDQARLDQAMQNFASSSPQPVGDLRRILDDKDVDAVLIATPNHWHSPAGILACDAGKHVYVEKPCSHNIREGRLLVEAARRNQRVVQHGTQVRSTPTIAQAVQMLHAGAIGKVLVAKTWNIQRRGSIGRAQPTDPPGGFDYDNWVGPATMVPFQANCFHGTYNWFYHFGSGDMGNDGVHDIDYCRWGLGVQTHASEISAAGGKFMFDDDQQYPDTQQVTFVYPGDGQPGSQRMLIYEQRLWSSNYPYNCDSGVEFYGTAGQMFLSRRGKLQVWDERNQKIEVNVPLGPQHDAAHVANFVEAVRTGITPNAEIEVGHLTASLCHLGNISTRLGRSLKFDPQAEQFIGDDEANRLVRREYRDHWGRPQNV